MSLRSRRAAWAVSSSASTTMRPPTMCSPPANRRVAETSALRQHGLVTGRRLSSSLTFAVIAMRAILPSALPSCCLDGRPPRSFEDVAVCRGETEGVVLARVVVGGDTGHDQLGAEAAGDPAQQALVGDDARVGQDVVEVQVGRVGGEDLEVVLGGEALGLTGVQLQVEGQDALGLGLVQGV